MRMSSERDYAATGFDRRNNKRRDHPHCHRGCGNGFCFHADSSDQLTGRSAGQGISHCRITASASPL